MLVSNACAQAVAPADGPAVDEIVVTGTRLQATGFTTPTPVTVQSAARIEQRARVNVADALNEIPSFQPTSGPGQAQRNAFSTVGASTVDLRGLGSGRTLVLLDGRRFVPINSGGAPDLSNIPTNLIDRVEVVTGGASAQYGSDAVAGVVNFVLNSKLEGIKANAQYGFSEHGDNREPALNLAVGHSFGEGKIHLIAGVDWSKNDGVGTQYERDWGRREPGVVGLSANRPAGTPANVVANYQEWSVMTTGGLITSGPLKGTAFGPGGATYPFQYGSLVGPSLMVGSPTNPNYGLSYTSQQRLVNPTRRFASLARINFDVTPDTTVFIEGSFGRNKVITNSSFSLQDQGDISILASNPYLPAGVASQVAATGATIPVGGVPTPGFMLGRLSTDLGQWGGIITNKVYRGVVGVKSKLWRDWTLDAYFQYGETDQDLDLFPVNTARFFQAAYAVRDPTTGAIVCGPTSTNPYFLGKNSAQRTLLNQNIGIGSSGPCVPLNLFGPNQNQAAQSYIRQNYDQAVITKQLVGSAAISGSPFATWAGPVNLAFGGEWRRDSADQTGDQVAINGGYTEVNVTALRGSIGVYEGFAEVGVPLLNDSQFGRSFDLNGAVRRTHYQYSGSVTTWKIGATYEPLDWLRLRATESRDIKAPTVSNLFSQGSAVLFLITNPQNGVSDSVQAKTVGNPDLQPEVAHTFTGGFVLSPKWGLLNSLRLSVDYFDIKLNGVISSISAPQILQRYFSGQSQYAQYITFDNSPIGIGRIASPLLNLNTLKTNGIDMEGSYRIPLESFNVPGRLNVSALVTRTIRLGTYSTVGGITTQSNRVGGTAFGDQGGPIPRWRATVTFDYNLGRFGATAQARIFSGFMYGTQFVGPGQLGYSPSLPNSISDNYVPGLAYWSLQLRYDVMNQGDRRLQLYATADNLFDKDPPMQALPMTQAGGSPYDLIGRTFRIGARLTL